MYTSFHFPKSARLLTSGQYSDVFQNVNLRVSSRHFLILATVDQFTEVRLGIIVAKKHVKLAVQRNRVKRILRDSFRCEKASLPAIDIVVLAKKGVDKLDNEACHKELQYLWQKLDRKYSSRDQ